MLGNKHKLFLLSLTLYLCRTMIRLSELLKGGKAQQFKFLLLKHYQFSYISNTYRVFVKCIYESYIQSKI